MRMRIIAGRAGSGKSRHILNEIGELLRTDLQAKIIMIVPDQFTYETERYLMDTLGLSGIMSLEVLSISRLCNRVISLCGGGARTTIDLIGKSMLIRRILSQKAGMMRIFGSMAEMSGFAPKMAEALSELKRFDVTAVDLRERAVQFEGSVLADKLSDMAEIFESLNNELDKGYADAEDRMNRCILQLPSSQLLNDTHVYIDGFEILTEQVKRAIETIFLYSASLTVTLRIDPNNNPSSGDLFSAERRLSKLFSDMAQEHGTVPEHIWLPRGEEGWRTSVPELRHLENELYANRAKPYSSVPEAVQIYTRKDPHDEVEHAAILCITLARERGYRWRDIAIACNALEKYGLTIKRIFSRYGIPFFLDIKRPMSDHPAVQFINASLRLLSRGWKQTDVLNLIKTGFTSLNNESVDLLENYILKYGIGTRGILNTFSEPAAENARKDLVGPLTHLEDGLASPLISAKCTALYRYMLENDLHKKLRHLQISLEKKGMLEESGETGQIWGKTIQIIDQLHELAGDEDTTTSVFASMLKSGFEKAEIGVIPTTSDQVLVGDIGRTISHSIDALIMIGVNDGILPRNAHDEDLLLDEELLELDKSGLRAGRRLEEKAEQEAMDIYTVLSKPRKMLSISYSATDNEGRPASPSLLIERLKAIFPHLQTLSDSHQTLELPRPVNPNGSFIHMADMLRKAADGGEITDEWWAAYHWYVTTGWEGKIDTLEKAINFRNNTPILSGTTANALYGTTNRLSVSRMESFLSCPFKHFTEYGLRPGIRKVYGPQPVDIGAYLHKGIEEFVNAVSSEEAWDQINEETCIELAGHIADSLAHSGEYSLNIADEKHAYLARRLRKTLQNSALAVMKHIKSSCFRPLGTEISFGEGKILEPLNIVLKDAGSFSLEGKIDRVDTCRDGKNVLFRVVDYKTGRQGIDWGLMKIGLRMQLPIYSEALMQSAPILPKEKAKWAGIFYFKIHDPLLQTNTRDIQDIENIRVRAYRMEGLVINEPDIIIKMGGESCINAGIKKDGSTKAGNGTISYTQAGALMEFAKETARKTYEGIIKGDIRIAPITRDGDLYSCKICDYHAICSYDGRFGVNNPRQADKLTLTDFFQNTGEGRETL